MAPALALHKCSEDRGVATCRTLILTGANPVDLCMSCYCQKHETCLKHLPGVKREPGVVHIFCVSCVNTRGPHWSSSSGKEAEQPSVCGFLVSHFWGQWFPKEGEDTQSSSQIVLGLQGPFHSGENRRSRGLLRAQATCASCRNGQMVS